MYNAICTIDDAGVARPMWNKDTSACRLMNQETGILTQNAPMIPCSITNVVWLHPLKYPMKQNKNEVSRKSRA